MGKRSIKTVLMYFLVASVAITSVVMGGLSLFSVIRTSRQATSNYETAMDSGYRTEIKSEVQTAITVLQTEYNSMQAGEITEGEAKERAKEIIRGMRYRSDSSGYFWIDDLNYILIMHPILSDREGENRINEQDQNGVMIIQSIVNSVQDPSANGYNEFYYTKSDGKTIAPKVAYSELFEPWGWIISTGNYVDDMEAEMAQAKAEIRRSLIVLVLIIIAASAALLLCFILLGRRFGNKLCGPIISLVSTAEDIAAGKIGILERSTGRNEIAQLQNSFCDVIENFKRQAEEINRLADGDLNINILSKSEEDLVGSALTRLVDDNNQVFATMKEAALQIDRGSEQIADTSQSLAEGASEQAQAVDSIGESVTQIADKARGNAKQVGEVNQMVKEAGSKLELGNSKMQDMLTAMQDIQVSSVEIEKVIQVIDDIALNTNILALNASVEAARAGSHGKGFAVVAEEVRQLAGRSADASRQTTKMIHDSIEKVERGAHFAKEAEDALAMIAECMQKITSLSQGIVQASEEQAASAAQITDALTQVSHITQTNSATSEQCASASVELSSQAKELHTQIAKFRLRQG